MGLCTPVLISETGWDILKIQIVFSLGHPGAYYPPNSFYLIVYKFTKTMENDPKTWFFGA